MSTSDKLPYMLDFSNTKMNVTVVKSFHSLGSNCHINTELFSIAASFLKRYEIESAKVILKLE